MEEQAVQTLNKSWLQAHNKHLQRWEQQMTNDANAVEEAQQAVLEEEQQEREAQQQVVIVMGNPGVFHTHTCKNPYLHQGYRFQHVRVGVLWGFVGSKPLVGWSKIN